MALSCLRRSGQVEDPRRPGTSPCRAARGWSDRRPSWPLSSAALDLDVTDLELVGRRQLSAPHEHVLAARVQAEALDRRQAVARRPRLAPCVERATGLVGHVDLSAPAVLEGGHRDGGDVVRGAELDPQADAGLGVSEVAVAIPLRLPGG